MELIGRHCTRSASASAAPASCAYCWRRAMLRRGRCMAEGEGGGEHFGLRACILRLRKACFVFPQDPEKISDSKKSGSNSKMWIFNLHEKTQIWHFPLHPHSTTTLQLKYAQEILDVCFSRGLTIANLIFVSICLSPRFFTDVAGKYSRL